MSKIAMLLQKDLRVIYRDGFLMMALVLPVILALVGRIATSLIPIEHIELYFAPLIVTASGTTLGTLLGYALIEEREQGTWLLLRVLPVPEVQLFGYLAGVAGSLSLAMVVLSCVVYGLVPKEPGLFGLLVLATTPFAGLFLLALGAATSNKVEGMAIGKFLGSVASLPLLVFVLPPAWQVLLWWDPLYWVYLGLLQAYAGSALLPELAAYWPGYPTWTYVVVPFVLSVGGFFVFARVYRRRAS
jgi:hypothetical protein